MVIICWNRRVTRRSQACLTFSLFMERRWVKIKMRERKLISGPGRHWEILEDSGWINHDVCEAVLKRSHWWDSDHRLENRRRRGGMWGGEEREDSLENRLMIETRRLTPSQWFSSQEQTNIDVQYQIQNATLGVVPGPYWSPRLSWFSSAQKEVKECLF